MNRVLRKRDRVLQGAPNTTNPLNALLFMAESSGFHLRKPLRTSLLVAADGKSTPKGAVYLPLMAAHFVNRFLQGNLLFQHLPVPFEVYADGIDFVIFEEFRAGQAALHLKDEVERNKLLQNEGYRRQFRKQLESGFDIRLWSRNLSDTEIVASPEASMVGKSFGDVAKERGVHPADAFLDLVVQYGQKVRWKFVVANHRPDILDKIASDPGLHLGFADSGAHLRNMAFYNFPVRFLRRVYEAERAGKPFISLQHAVHRLTGELAAFFGVDAGTLREGDRADIAIINPAGLTAEVDGYYEAEMPDFGGIKRMVNRSGNAVSATLIGGKVVFEAGDFVAGFGKRFRTGRFFRAGEPSGTVDTALLQSPVVPVDKQEKINEVA
jgi:N-acyl-D-aspartate/D-glutamate deacylase